jgi:hypothetical protein
MVPAMKKALIPALSLALCLFAAGCTDSDWNHLLSFGGGAEEEPVTAPAAAPAPQPEATAAAAPAPAPALPPNAEFCKNIATEDATRNGFDPATQQRVFQRSFTQCVAIYTR